jgi:hypothetical protein
MHLTDHEPRIRISESGHTAWIELWEPNPYSDEHREDKYNLYYDNWSALITEYKQIHDEWLTALREKLMRTAQNQPEWTL